MHRILAKMRATTNPFQGIERMKIIVRLSPSGIDPVSFIPFATAFRTLWLRLAGCLLLGAAHAVHAQQNTPPTISPIPDQVTDEDTPLIGIPFTVRDAQTPADQLRFSTKFLFPDGFLSSGSVVLGGNGTNRWLSVFPPHNTFGTGSVVVVVNDTGGLSASSHATVA